MKLTNVDYTLLESKVKFHQTKNYLCYNKNTGWNVVKLNFFQRFFRKIFGAYSSTHLKFIKFKLNRVNECPKPLKDRINQLWFKTFVSSKKSFIHLAPTKKTILEKLSLSFSLEFDIKNLHKLTHLNLYKSNISAIPDEIELLQNIEILNFSSNQIDHLPNEFTHLTSLVFLDLSSNNLTELPQEFHKLNQLRECNLSHNNLKSIPQCLYNLSKDCSVLLYGNPIPLIEFQKLQEIVRQPNYQGPKFYFSLEGQEKIKEVATKDQNFLEFNASNFARLSTLDEKDQNTLQTWLARLQNTADFNGVSSKAKFIKRVDELLEWMNELSIEDRVPVFSLLEDAVSTCKERVSLSVSDLFLMKLLDKEKQGALPNLAKLILGLSKLNLLEKIAFEKVQTMHAVDEVLVFLHYRLNLQDKLDLPRSIDEMLYQKVSGLEQIDFDQAEAFVKQKINNPIEILLANEIWKKRISNESRFQEISLQCDEAKEKFLEDHEGNEASVFAEFKLKDQTIWNPYRIFTEELKLSLN